MNIYFSFIRYGKLFLQSLKSEVTIFTKLNTQWNPLTFGKRPNIPAKRKQRENVKEKCQDNTSWIFESLWSCSQISAFVNWANKGPRYSCKFTSNLRDFFKVEIQIDLSYFPSNTYPEFFQLILGVAGLPWLYIKVSLKQEDKKATLKVLNMLHNMPKNHQYTIYIHISTKV